MSLPDMDLTAVSCRNCGALGELRIEWRERLIAKPLGTFSLAGAQMKVTAYKTRWPWMVCDACGASSMGKSEALEQAINQGRVPVWSAYEGAPEDADAQADADGDGPHEDASQDPPA